MKEGIEVEGLDALLAAGRRLLDLDADRFQRVLSLARAYVAAYERPEEPDEVFASRVSQVTSRLPKPSA